MKRPFLALAALLACVSPVDAQARGGAPTGDQVLERSRSAYAGLSSYAGVTVVLSEIAIGDTVMLHATGAEMHFARPGRFRLSGHAIDGSPYLVVSDGARTRLALVPAGPKAREEMLAMEGLVGIRPAGGDTLASDTPSAEMGLEVVTGIGNRVPYYLPALLGLTRGSPLVQSTPAVLTGRERVGGIPSYRVVVPGPQTTLTFWVDTASYLVRQIQDEPTRPQLAGSFGQAGENPAGRDAPSGPSLAGASAPAAGPLRAAPHPRGASYLVRFTNLHVTAPLDPALFALPPRGADSRPPE